MFNQVTANDLKVRGIQLIDDMIADDSDGVVVTVRGKEKYVILPVAEYHLLRELELDAAIAQTKKELAEGSYHADSVAEHMKRIESDV